MLRNYYIYKKRLEGALLRKDRKIMVYMYNMIIKYKYRDFNHLQFNFGLAVNVKTYLMNISEIPLKAYLESRRRILLCLLPFYKDKKENVRRGFICQDLRGLQGIHQHVSQKPKTNSGSLHFHLRALKQTKNLYCLITYNYVVILIWKEKVS